MSAGEVIPFGDESNRPFYEQGREREGEEGQKGQKGEGGGGGEGEEGDQPALIHRLRHHQDQVLPYPRAK